MDTAVIPGPDSPRVDQPGAVETGAGERAAPSRKRDELEDFWPYADVAVPL